MIRDLTVAEVQHIAYEVARQLMQWDEPIPDFETRYPGRLESCLRTPFQTFDKKDLYKGLTAKAAILFYLMIKNHPFENGKKRIAVTTLLVFLHLNGKWLRVDHGELYRFSVGIAESDPYYREQQVQIIERFIQRYLTSKT